MAKAKTIEEIQAAIEEKGEKILALTKECDEKVSKVELDFDAKIAKIAKEIDKLKEQGLAGAKAIAESFGYQIVKPGAKPTKKKSGGASKEDKAAWLRMTVGDGIAKKELSDKFKDNGLGQRLRLDQFTDIVEVDDEDNVTLVK